VTLSATAGAAGSAADSELVIGVLLMPGLRVH